MGKVSEERERKRAGGESKGRGWVAVEEKMRKRNFVVFACVCEKIFVPLHAFRAYACKLIVKAHTRYPKVIHMTFKNT